MDISVIVPAFNVEKYINRCIDSLLSQSFNGSYEIIIIDDGSQDKTGGICKEYAQHNSNVRYFHKENGGISSARNLGLDNSVGTYVAFIDSDDYISNNYLEVLYDLCERENADISMCCANRCYGSDGKGKKFDSGFSEDFVSSEINKILYRSSFAPWAKMYKKSLFEEMRFPLGITYEDFALIPQIIFKANKIAYTDQQLYHYFFNGNSIITHRKTTRKADRNIIKAQHILENSALKDSPDILENFYIRRVIFSLIWNMLEYGESLDDVKCYLDEGKIKFPTINRNDVLKKASLGKKVFFFLINAQFLRCAKIYVQVYCKSREILLKGINKVRLYGKKKK